MKAIQVRECGGPEKMEYVDVPMPEPGPKQVRVKVAAAGVNFIDVYFRTGLYKADLPITLGMEGAGTIDALGPGGFRFSRRRSGGVGHDPRLLRRIRSRARGGAGEDA